MNLRSISVLVTGANRGLGHAFAVELLARGVACLYAGVRRPAELSAAFPGEARVRPLPLDIADLASVEEAARHVDQLDLLINNAATLEHGDLLATGALEVLERAWQTNVRGPLAVTRAFLPALRRSPAAAVINVNSIAALCPFADVPAYAASKSAALSLTQALRRELAPAGVPVYSVLPGVLRTGMAAWLDCAKADPRAVARTVLEAVERDASGDMFPDAGALAFWETLKAAPSDVLFVPPAPNLKSTS